MILDWSKTCFRFSCTMWRKNLNELFGNSIVWRGRLSGLLLYVWLLDFFFNFFKDHFSFRGFPGGSEYACNAGDSGSIPGLGRYPGEGKGNPLQYCLDNPVDRGACGTTVHGLIRVRHNLLTKSPTSLKNIFQSIYSNFITLQV